MIHVDNALWLLMEKDPTLTPYAGEIRMHLDRFNDTRWHLAGKPARNTWGRFVRKRSNKPVQHREPSLRVSVQKGQIDATGGGYAACPICFEVESSSKSASCGRIFVSAVRYNT